MNPDARPITLEDCKIPEQTLTAKTMYKLLVSFKQNGIMSKETQHINVMTLEDNFPKPSCVLEGFSDTINLEEDDEHRVRVRVFDTMDN